MELTVENVKTAKVTNELRYCRLHYAAPTATGVGFNDFCELDEISPGLFVQRKGRIGITVGQYAPRQIGQPLPMTGFDTLKEQLQKKGWVLFTERRLQDKKVSTKTGTFEGMAYKPEPDEGAQAIIERLWMYANKESEESYTYRVADIPKEMIALGTAVLKDLRATYGTISEAMFNAKLMQYFAYIPRRMKKLVCTRNTPGTSTKDKMQKILDSEEEKLAFLMDQIKSVETAGEADNTGALKTITETFGMEWRTATPEELAYVKSMMDARNRDHVIGCWKVKNLKTAERFEKYCADHDLSEGNGISHLWHGSPAQNWWSISTNGLWLKPGLNGGMFGPGLYFAPESDKSVGYTGFGCWRGVGSDNGFLALNKVATGKPFWFYENNGTSSDFSLASMKRRGTDCLWAHSKEHDKSNRSSLYRDEVIIYDDAQSTIEYLVEVQKH